MRENERDGAPRAETRQTDEARAADYLALAEKLLGVCDSVTVKEAGR